MPRILPGLLLFALAVGASEWDCPPEGRGGDGGLNLRKNRVAVPARYESITFAQLAALPSQRLAARMWRNRWPAWWTREVDGHEARAVTLEGFVAEARIMGPESANCGDRKRGDVHFAIAPAPGGPRAEWVVTELTPRVRERHPAWHLKRLKALSRDKARVRVSGWLLYDHEHLDRVGINRVSAWEIHPVTRIEVERGGVWTEF